MSTSRTLLWSSALLGSLLFAFGSATGCSSDDTNDDPQNDAGGSSSGGSSGASSSSGNVDGGGSSSGGSSSGGSSSGNTTDAGTSIPIPDGATLTWASKGGFGPGPVGDASTCTQVDDTYVYEVASKSLSWKLCRPVPGVPEDVPAYAFDEGTATLTEAQDGNVHAALDNVVINPNAGAGGADKPYVTLKVTEPNDASVTYEDQFYHTTNDGKTYVDGLDALGAAFNAVVTAPD